MKKRFFAMLLATLMLLGAAACSTKVLAAGMLPEEMAPGMKAAPTAASRASPLPSATLIAPSAM